MFLKIAMNEICRNICEKCKTICKNYKYYLECVKVKDKTLLVKYLICNKNSEKELGKDFFRKFPNTYKSYNED